MKKASSTTKARAKKAKIRVEPASATEIRAALGITAAEVKVAARAVRIASSTKPASSAVKVRRTTAGKGRRSGVGAAAGR